MNLIFNFSIFQFFILFVCFICRANIDREARIWFDAISTFYLNPKGKIVKHVVDNKDIDHERTVKRPIDEIKEKLAKLNKNTPTAAPALSKIHSKSV